MNTVLIGALIFALMLALLMLRVPVTVAMMGSAMLGILIISGPKMMFMQFMNGPFAQAASYTLALMPLFSFMGIMLGDSGIAEGALTASNKWLARTRGGMLNTVIVANTIFGACSGTANAGSIVFSRMCMPTLEKEGYERSNALACVCSASVLAMLIPPSVSIVVVCTLTENSISYGLMCGIGAGLITMALLMLCVQIIARVKPGAIPPRSTEVIPLKEKLASLRLLIPIVVLFVIIIIGAYVGFFTSTVGGAVGSMVVFIYALIKGMPLKKILQSAKTAAVINCATYPMILGGTMFGRLVTLSRIPDVIVDWIASIHMPTIVVFTVILAFYIFCGCVMDISVAIYITVPIIYPIMTALGFQPFAIVMFIVIMINTGGITPPVGLGVFVTANALKIQPTEIFKGIMPYVLVFIITAYLFAFFPQLITFLPNVLA